MNKRVKWIDVAKGICMISVILGHLGVEKINNVVYSYHLSLFFMLSGYTMKRTAVDREYLNKKFKSLMQPYLITSFCIILLDVFNCFMLWHNASSENVTYVIANDLIKAFWASGAITSFGTIEIGSRIGVIWFLPALFFSLVFVQIVIYYIKDKKLQWVMVGIGALAGTISAKFIWLPFSIQSALMAMPYILLGYEIKQRDLIKRINLKMFLICLIIFLIGIKEHVSLISFVNADSPDFFLSFIVGVASSVCIIYISMKLEKWKPLELIGRYSLYFMCIHLLEAEQMGTWKWRILEHFGINNKVVNFFVPLILISLIVFLITRVKKGIAWFDQRNNIGKVDLVEELVPDFSIGMLVILLIMGNFVVAQNFWSILNSFHMMAFVFYLGYCFNETACDNMKTAVLKLIKLFIIPYSCFGIVYCLITHEGILIEIKNILYGSSTSIGAAYFVLILFLVCLIYLIIQKYITRDWVKHILIFNVSLCGFLLGKYGYWLPWNIDIAMYSILFYHLGYCFKKYKIMEYVCNRYYWYFLLSCIWVYMIYQGGMEIRVRDYGSFSLSIMGAVCGIVLFYMFSRSILNINKFLSKGMQMIGRSLIYILIIHTLFNYHVYMWVGCMWEEGYFQHLIFTVLIQVIAGVIITIGINKIASSYTNNYR